MEFCLLAAASLAAAAFVAVKSADKANAICFSAPPPIQVGDTGGLPTPFTPPTCAKKFLSGGGEPIEPPIEPVPISTGTPQPQPTPTYTTPPDGYPAGN